MSFRGGALCVRTFPVSASTNRTELFPLAASFGTPSCPASQNASQSGSVNVPDRNTPVKCSPPGGKLEMNVEFLFPSADSRFCKNHGFADAGLPCTGRFRHEE